MIVIGASALAKYPLREEDLGSIEEHLVSVVYSVDLVVKGGKQCYMEAYQ